MQAGAGPASVSQGFKASPASGGGKGRGRDSNVSPCEVMAFGPECGSGGMRPDGGLDRFGPESTSPVDATKTCWQG